MRYAAFLRAINVGGHIVKMDRLRTLFEAAGFRGVETFIASGNVVSSRPGGAAVRSGTHHRDTSEEGARISGRDIRALDAGVGGDRELQPFGPESLKPPDSVFVGFLRSAVGRTRGGSSLRCRRRRYGDG